MRRETVLLRHSLSDSAHYDWMIAQDAAGILPLITFRVAYRPDEIAAGSTMRAARIQDHRPTYLRWEGTLSGGRGTVERVRAGTVELWSGTGDAWRLVLRWDDDPPRVFSVCAEEGSSWLISVDEGT